jgi:hypothetical protein
MEKSLELHHEWMSSFTNERPIYIVLMGCLIGVMSFHYFIVICFIFQIPWVTKKPWVNSMGCKNHAHGFSPLIIIIIIIIFPPNTMGVYHGLPKPWAHIFPMVKRNNYHGDLVEEVDGHRFSLGSSCEGFFAFFKLLL